MFFDFRQPVKMQWQIVWLNVSAAVLNLSLVAWHISNGKWMFIANLISGIFSAWVAWRCWRKIPEITQREQDRILDILKGKYDRDTDTILN